MLYENLFYDKKVNALFTEAATVSYMLQFEAALALAQAQCDLIPYPAAQAIQAACKIENIDIEKLISEVNLGANVPIPLVKQLTAVLKQQKNGENTEGGKYVHFGATSQDVVDTAMMLQIRDAISIILEILEILIKQLVLLMGTHRNTLMIGRSFMQQAKPITFGFKVATWLDGILRSKKRLDIILKDNFTVQLGGAVGTLARA